MANIRYQGIRRLSFRGKPSRLYYARRVDHDTGKRTWRCTLKSSKDAAERQVRLWEKEEAEGPRPAAIRMTFHEALDRWLTEREADARLTDDGLASYRGYVAGWKKFFSADLLLAGIGAKDLRRYFRVRQGPRSAPGTAPAVPPPAPPKERRKGRRPRARGARAAPATMNRERMVLAQVFAWARTEVPGYTGNPVEGVRPFKVPNRAVVALSEAEQAALLTACRGKYRISTKGKRNVGAREGGQTTDEPIEWNQSHEPAAWLYPIVRLSIATGLRMANLEHLLWSEVDFANGVVRIPAAKMKARADFVLPLDAETVGYLRELWAERRGPKVLDFPHRANYRRTLRLACKRAGIERHVRPHDLRATYISNLCRRGVSLHVAAKLAAHADIRTTQKHYVATDEAQIMREAAEKLGYRGGDGSTEERHQAT